MFFQIKKYLLILMLIINNCALADPKSKLEKYHTLQVSIAIVEQPSQSHKHKDLNKNLAETIKKDLLIFHATTEQKLTKHRIENLHDRANQEITCKV